MVRKASGYGTCTLCGLDGSIQFHHIIPKRLRNKSERKLEISVQLNHESNKIDSHKFKKWKLVNSGILLCRDCHKLMHPENIYVIKKEIKK